MKSTYTKRSPVFILLSILLTIIALGIGIFFGVTGKISTGGGARLTYSYDLAAEISQKEVQKSVSGFSVQLGETTTSENETLGVITLHSGQTITADQGDSATQALQSSFKDANITAMNTNLSLVRGGGSDLLVRTIIAFAVTAVLVLAYTLFRFRRIGGWASGIVALWMALQNTIITFAIQAVIGLPINAFALSQLAAVAALSLIGPLVVLDAVRSNIRLTALEEILIVSVQERTNIVLTVGGMFVLLLLIVGIITSSLLAIIPGLIGALLSMATALLVAAPLWSKLSKTTKATR